jgi:hypothetical protein
MNIYTAIKHSIIILLSILLFSSCEEKNATIGKCVLVYMAANNNLSVNALNNLSEIENGYVPNYFEIGKSGDVLLVYINTEGVKPRLYRVSKDRYGNVNKETIVEYEEHNSADPQVMSSILQYSRTLFPAKENGLILWSHGTGWLPQHYYKKTTSSLLSLEQDNEDPYADLVKSFGKDGDYEMDILDLCNNAIKDKYSYIIFDACLMGGIEVVYELKDKADYIISSPAEVLVDSFPYEVLMSYLFANVTDLVGACEAYYQYYLKQESLVRQSATVSLVKSDKLYDLASSTKKIFDAYRDKVGSLDMNNIQRFFRNNKHYFYDLTDFVSSLCPDGDPLLANFISNMDAAVIYKRNTPKFLISDGELLLQRASDGYNGFVINKFSGLSTYVQNPENIELDTYYTKYSWNRDTGMIVK